jgi:hypothetical protein
MPSTAAHRICVFAAVRVHTHGVWPHVQPIDSTESQGCGPFFAGQLLGVWCALNFRPGAPLN